MGNVKPSLAWLGCGLMGTPMAERLLQHGYSVQVWNRTPAKAEVLKDKGAEIAVSAVEAVATGDVVFTMLSDFNAIDTALAGIDWSGKLLVQMATIGPGENQRLADRIVGEGGTFLEAPVLGSIPEASAGKLIVMAGGPEIAFQRALPMLLCLGPEPRRIGEIGEASALKLALNQLIAGLTAVFSTSLAFAQEHGVGVDILMDILRQSALYAPTFDKKLGKMQEHNYRNPNFPTEHLIKDIDLFIREAKTIDLQMLEVLRLLYSRAQREHPREDYSCVFDAIQKRC